MRNGGCNACREFFEQHGRVFGPLLLPHLTAQAHILLGNLDLLHTHIAWMPFAVKQDEVFDPAQRGSFGA